jgi:hypothetical protein
MNWISSLSSMLMPTEKPAGSRKNSGKQLHLPCGTVNSKYKKQIRYADSAPALMEHTQKKYDWSKETADKIDWTAHGQAI